MDKDSTEQSPIRQLIEEFFYPEKRHFRILEAAQYLTKLLKKSENKKHAIDFIIEHLSKLRQEAEGFFSEELAQNKAISIEEKNRWLTLHQQYMDALLVWIDKTLNGTDAATDIARLQAKRDNLIEQSKQHLYARIDNAEEQKEKLKKQIEAKIQALLESKEIKLPSKNLVETQTKPKPINTKIEAVIKQLEDWSKEYFPDKTESGKVELIDIVCNGKPLREVISWLKFEHHEQEAKEIQDECDKVWQWAVSGKVFLQDTLNTDESPFVFNDERAYVKLIDLLQDISRNLERATINNSVTFNSTKRGYIIGEKISNQSHFSAVHEMANKVDQLMLDESIKAKTEDLRRRPPFELMRQVKELRKTETNAKKITEILNKNYAGTYFDTTHVAVRGAIHRLKKQNIAEEKKIM